MKRLVLPITILAMSILSIVAALSVTEKARRQSAPEFQRQVVDPSPVCTLSEGFDNVGNLVGMGWFMQNNSMPLGGTGWYQGNPAMFTSQSGAPNSYIAADFNNGSGAATISNWLLTPPLLLQNGGVLTFWTRTVTAGAQLFPDRVQLRMSTNGTSTNVGSTATSVGDFTTLLLDINPTYADNYPHVWTQYTITITGLGSSTTGRLAFRYFVENGGPSGTRSDYIGIDTMTYICPSPTPSPTPTPTPTPTPSPTLGNYPNTSLPLSTDATVTPDATPTYTTRINVSTSTNFKGKLEGYPTTGVVRVTDAHPAGNYTVTVKAFNGALMATRTFTLTVTTPATCIPVSFAPAVAFPAGSRPSSVAIGDFNGDGNQDLAATDNRPNSSFVFIFLGDGAGHFSAATHFAADTGPTSVAVGDFNGDGNQDLAVTSAFIDRNVSILLGDGAGGFGAPTNFAVPNVPNSVAVGDFNGDGNQDLAVANGSNVSILLGDGAGGFGAATNFAACCNACCNSASLAVGDFNGDGNQDLAIATEEVSILLGDGAGHFGAPTDFAVGANPVSVAVGDFNGDGNQDLAVVNSGSSNVSILLGDGAGGFGAATNFGAGSGPDSVAVGDFNGDGNQDLAVANSGSNNVSILLGDGAGHFSAATSFSVSSPPQSVAVGDFNGDGKQDLAVANYSVNTGQVSILLRDCTLTPTSIVSRMTHGSAGTFDINLPLTGSPGIECRTTGRTTNDYTIIVTFANPVTVTGNPQAAVTLGTGCVGSSGACSGSVNVSGNAVTIPLTNVTNAQTINVTLFQVNGGGNVVIPMGVLAGDVNGNRAVNAADVAFAKGHIGQPVDVTNFRADVNFNGTINASDVSLVKSNLGTGLP